MTTMTAEDLRAIITPSVEADLKAAGLWPERDGRVLHCDDESLQVAWYWVKNHPQHILCHTDDAHAQIERRLVEWLAKWAHDNQTCGPHIDYVHCNGGDWSVIVGNARWLRNSLLECLLAAFAGRNRNAPTGEKEGA